MKRVVILVVLVFGAATKPCHAQSTGDLIEQLVLDFQKLQDMKSILQDMYNGYKILDKGYTQIRNIAQGQFNLHKAFLDGLLAVSPAVRNYYRVAKILDAEYNLVKEYKAGAGRVPDMDMIYSTLFSRSLQSINELTMIITDGELRMSDAQRLGAIDRVYVQINGQLRAIRQLNNETSVQTLQRQREANDIQTLKRIYDDP